MPRLDPDPPDSQLGSQPVQPSQCLFLWKTLFWCKDIFTCFSTDFHNVSTRFLINRCNFVTTFELITSQVVSRNSLKPFYFLKFVFQPLAIFFIFSLAFPSYKSVSENSTWRPNKIYEDRLSVWLSPTSNAKRRKENFMIFLSAFPQCFQSPYWQGGFLSIFRYFSVCSMVIDETTVFWIKRSTSDTCW